MTEKRRPIAHPYFRWSTSSQTDGDTLDRQEALVPPWHAENPEYILAPARIDAGVPGSHKANVQRGRLGEILQEIRDGTIKPDDLILVESWSRITRDHPMDAVELVMQILRAGVGIVFLTLRKLYTLETIRADPTQFLMMVVESLPGHQSNVERVRHSISSWIKTRKQGGAKGPSTGWLKREGDRWVPIPAAVAAIVLIFEEYVANYGVDTIVTRLNRKRDVWRPKSGRWTKSYVDLLLTDHRLIGERQWYLSAPKVNGKRGKRQPIGDPVPGHFPIVIDPDLFYRVQALRAPLAKEPGNGGGRSGKNYNLFRGRAKCGVCGDRMDYIDKGRPRYQYLQCAPAADGVECTNRKGIRYDKLWPVLLYHIRGFDAQNLLLDEGQRASVNAQREMLLGRIEELNKEVKNLRRSIARTDDDDRAKELEDELKQVLARRAEREEELDRLPILLAPQQIKEHLNAVGQLVTRLEEQWDTPEGAERRGRVIKHLKQLVERIDIAVGAHRSRIHIKFWHSGRLLMILDAECKVIICRTKFPDDPKPTVDSLPELDQNLVETLSRRGLKPYMTATRR